MTQENKFKNILLDYSKTIIPLAGYFLFSFIVFFDVYIGRARFIFRDLLKFVYPMGGLFAKYFRGEGSFLWDNTINHGVPFLARYTPGVFYPFNVLFAFFGVNVAISITIISHFIIASIATYFLIKRHVSCSWIAWMGGLAYGFGGYGFSLNGSWIYFFGFALLPLSILFIYRVYEKPSIKRIIGLAVVFVMQFFAAEPQVLFYEIVFVIPAIIFILCKERNEIFKLSFYILLAGFLALGLSSCQLLPALEFSQYSIRAQGVSSYQAATWSFMPIRLIEYIIPLFWGGYWPEFSFWGHDYINPPIKGALPWALSVYVGIYTLIGIFFLSLKNNKKIIITFSGLFVFFLFLAFGRHTFLYEIIYTYLPGANLFRFPEKFFVFINLFLVVLGSIGLSNFFNKEINFKQKKIMLILIIGILLIVLHFLVIRFDSQLEKNLIWFGNLIKTHYNKAFTFTLAELLDKTLTAIYRTQFIVVAFLAVIVLTFFKKIGAKTIIFLFIIIGCIDIYFSAISIRGVSPAKWITKSPEICKHISQNQLHNPFLVRFGQPVADKRFIMENLDSDYELTQYLIWNLALGNVGVDLCIHQVHAYESANLLQWEHIQTLGFKNPHRLNDLLGVQYVLEYADSPEVPSREQYERVVYLSEYKYQILRNKDPLPFLFPVGRVKTVNNIEGALNILFNEEFSFKEVVVFETRDKLNVKSNARREANLFKYQAGTIKANLNYEDNGYLMILENYYPGWKAYLNGQKTTIYKANGSFMGLVIPQGNHELKVIFDPGIQKIANSISGIFILIILSLLVVDFKKRGFINMICKQGLNNTIKK